MREQKRNLRDLGINETWTLFLDRDGVINQRIEGDYVRVWAQFKFLSSSAEAITRMSRVFGMIIVITNQRGVARKLIREVDLLEINRRMVEEISRIGGRIDRVYVCPHDLHEGCNCRKPKIGLALEAKKDFPGIEFSKSIMVGDDYTDAIFANALKMKSVLLIGDNRGEAKKVRADFVFKDLLEVASSL